MLPYLFVCGLMFYILPLITNKKDFVLTLVLVVFPVTCFIVSLVYGILNRFTPFQLLFPIFVGTLFIPAMFIFYNYTAWIFMAAYTLFALMGNAAGYVVSLYRPSGV